MEEEQAADMHSTREWSTPAAHEANGMPTASPRGEEQTVLSRQFFSVAFNWRPLLRDGSHCSALDLGHADSCPLGPWRIADSRQGTYPLISSFFSRFVSPIV